MANRLKGEIDETLPPELEGAAGLTVRFRLGMNELINLQEALGYGDDDERFMAEVDSGKAFRGLKRIRTAVLHALLKHQPEMTQERAGEIVTLLGPDRVGELLTEAMKWAMPEPAESKGQKRGKGAASPGAPSS